MKVRGRSSKVTLADGLRDESPAELELTTRHQGWTVPRPTGYGLGKAGWVTAAARRASRWPSARLGRGELPNRRAEAARCRATTGSRGEARLVPTAGEDDGGGCASGGEGAQVVHRRPEKRVLQVEEAGPQGRAIRRASRLAAVASPSSARTRTASSRCTAEARSAPRALRARSSTDATRRARLLRDPRTTTDPRHARARARAGTARGAARARRAPSRRDPPHVAAAACRAPGVAGFASPLPSARAIGRTRATTPRTRAAARPGAARSARSRRSPRSRTPSLPPNPPLDLDHHREHHRAPARAVVDDLAHGVVDVLLEELDLRDVFAGELTHHTIGLGTQFVQ